MSDADEVIARFVSEAVPLMLEQAHLAPTVRVLIIESAIRHLRALGYLPAPVSPPTVPLLTRGPEGLQ